jgi:hypothetical protein
MGSAMSLVLLVTWGFCTTADRLSHCTVMVVR